MTGKTHRVGGMLACLTGYSILQSKGMLINNVDPLLQFTIMYPFAIYGSMVSDMDHDWEQVPSKDIVSWFLWKSLHLTTGIRRWLNKGKYRRKLYRKTKGLWVFCDSKHRSWQTHSDLSLSLMIFLSIVLITRGTNADSILIALIFEGLLLGIISHLVLDLLTPEGIWSFLLTPIKKLLGGKGLAKLSLVPNSHIFATQSDESLWERLIRKLMWLSCFLLAFRLIWVFSPYRFEFVTGNL